MNWDNLDLVLGTGPQPADIFLLGERPGEQESVQGTPFVGPSGQEQTRYLLKAGISEIYCYRSNICKDYLPGNPDPTPDEILRDWPLFIAELELTQPRYLATIGAISTRAILGDWATMEVCHGMSYWHKLDGWEGWVIPIYHPAGGLHNNDMQPVIQYDYRMLGAYYKGKVTPVHKQDQHPNTTYKLLTGIGDVDLALIRDAFKTLKPMSIDTEGWRDDPWSLQFSITPGTGYTIRANTPFLIKYFGDLLHQYQPLIIMQSALHDLEVLRVMKIYPRHYEDTMILAYQLQLEPQGLKPLAKRHAGMSMKSYTDIVGEAQGDLTLNWLNEVDQHDWGKAKDKIVWVGGKYKTRKSWTPNRRIQRIFEDVSTGKLNPADIIKKRLNKWDDLDYIEHICGPVPRATLSDVPLDSAIQYASRDPDATLRVYPVLKKMCSAMSLDTSLKIDHDVLPMIEHMQSRGLQVDVPGLEIYSSRLQNTLDKIIYEVENTLGHFINPNSGDQLAKLFYHKFKGIPMPKHKTKGGRPQLDDAALNTIKIELEGRGFCSHSNRKDAQKAIKIIDLTLDYRENLKLKSTYSDPILNLLVDDILHPNFRVTKVVSGRLSANEPNVLAMPARTELGRQIKKYFIARLGHLFGTWDFSGIEMRVMAHCAQDPVLMDIFQKDLDQHSITASKIFGKPEDQIDKITERYPAKTMGFLIIYGGGPSTLQDNLKLVGLDWPLDRCEELIKEYLILHHGIDKFMIHQINYCRRHGFVRTMHGRIRYLPGIWSDIKHVRLEAERMAVNHPIQGGAQEIIKKAMANLWPILQELWTQDYSVHPLLQIHDELFMEFQDDLWEIIDPIMCDTMISAVKLSVPLKVGGDYGKTWYDLDK